MDKKTWGANLQRLRRARSLTQEELAEKSGIARSIIARLEAGLQDDALVETAATLAAALGCSLDTLIAGGA